MVGLTNIVYNVVAGNQTGGTGYTLQVAYDRFNVPKKIYGNIYNNAVRVWNSFAKEKTSGGVLLTGDSGAGKSLTGALISNIALDYNFPVLYVSSMELTIELIGFLSKFTNVVIYIDEFSKLTDYRVQNSMLSFLSDSNYRRLFILTDNDADRVSPYIKNRPGRIRYHLNFEKVEREVIPAYCSDYNVTKEFENELLNLYDRSGVFSFDHLQALVNEHIAYPNDSLEVLLKILNLHDLNKPLNVYICSIHNKETNELVGFERSNYITSYDEFRRGDNIHAYLFNGGSVSCNIHNISSMDGRTYILDNGTHIFKVVADVKPPRIELPKDQGNSKSESGRPNQLDFLM